MNTKVVGNKTEARILSSLLEVYPTVLLPFGDNEKYDFVFEDFDKSFKRVQCKTGRYRNGSITFNGYSTTRINGKHTTTLYQEGDFEFYGVACSEFPETWLVPISEAGSTGSLRIDQYPGNRSYSCKWAKDYVLYNPCK